MNNKFKFPVSEAMTLHPITCREGTKIADVANVFLERKIDSLAVVDKNKALVGMITTSDLLELLCDEDDSKCARVLPFKFRSFHHEEWTKTASSVQ